MSRFILVVQIHKVMGDEPDVPVNNDYITIPLDHTMYGIHAEDWNVSAVNALDLLIRRNWREIGLAECPPLHAEIGKRFKPPESPWEHMNDIYDGLNMTGGEWENAADEDDELSDRYLRSRGEIE